MLAVVVEEPGGPDRLALKKVASPSPGDHDVQIEVAYAGVNWGDLQKRKGTYPDPVSYPAIIGLEVSGRVSAIGRRVTGCTVGDRVAAITGPRMLGGYAEACVVPESYAMKIPDEIDDRTAAALPAASLTAWHLLHTAATPARGDTILVHAVGGAVGLMLTQIARDMGINVIGTVGNAAKARRPAELGAQVIDRSRSDFVAETMALTERRGVDLVIDSLGAAHLERSFDCLKSFGRVINIGEAGGYPDFDIRAKLYERSTSLAGFEFLHAVPGSRRWTHSVVDILDGFSSGRFVMPIERIFPLAAVANAHELLETRGVSGKLLLEVSARP